MEMADLKLDNLPKILEEETRAGRLKWSGGECRIGDYGVTARLTRSGRNQWELYIYVPMGRSDPERYYLRGGFSELAVLVEQSSHLAEDQLRRKRQKSAMDAVSNGIKALHK